MVFVMDVGNTNIVMGVYNNDELVANWRIGTDKDKTSDEYGILILTLLSHKKIDTEQIKSVVISSVVPPIMYSLEHAMKKYFNVNPIIIGPGIKTGINVKYDNPKEVGADRIVNAVAGYKIYGGPLIIVDFGTATTFCAITSNGDYLGGIISPGIEVAAEALYQKAAKLPKVDLYKPRRVIGRNTISSMQSGIIYGYIGQVDYIVSKMKNEMNENGIKVIGTGGMAWLIYEGSKTIDNINNMLTLEGLKIIYEMNKPLKV